MDEGPVGNDIEIEDVEDALLKADEYAKVMGRTKKDIVADLLDDGKLNHSAGSDATGKDLLDIAQEKAEKLKTLLTTLIPIAMLLLSVGAEGIGIIDVTNWSMSGDDDEDDVEIIWGCMDEEAINYDPDANEPDDCEFEDDEDEVFCEGYLFNEQVSLKDDDAEQDAVIISADLGITSESEDSCDDQTFHIHWKLEADGGIMYEYDEQENGYRDDPDGADYMSHIFDNVAAGTYTARVYLDLDGHLMDEKEIGQVVVAEPEPEERCDVVIYDIAAFMENNNTTAVVEYDLDCGEDGEEGFDVSVQFSIRLNGSNGDYDNYSQGFHHIEGEAWDVHQLRINDLQRNTTYNFYWIGIWEDEEGETHNINRSWSGVETR